MLKNKNINMVLAIIIAIALWAYVLGDVNPTTNLTIKDVPITFENENTLEYAGLTILDLSHDSIDITVSGPRTEVTKVKQSDFSVVADVEALAKGSNVVRISVKGPDKVEITDISTDKITVLIDQLVSIEKDIQVMISDTEDNKLEPYVVEISKNTINVSGANALVEKVEKVHAIVDASKVENSMKTLTAELVAVDANGNIIDGVILEESSVNVTVVMHHKKTVNLDVPVENMQAGEYERSIKVPKTIVIKGEDEVISKIETVTCEAIDLSKYTKTTTVDISPILPAGVQISVDSPNLKAEVAVKELSKAVVRVLKENVKLVNATAELEYEVVVDDMTIAVRGKESNMVGLDINAFKITADVKELGEGKHTVKVLIEYNENLYSIKPSTDEIEVIIK